MPIILDKLQIIGAEIDKSVTTYQRSKDEIQLLAVSKRHSIKKIQEAYDVGQKSFGENYVQELLEKEQALSDLNIDWHFIGALQSNKTKSIAAVANWVHTIDRLKIAQRLNDQRPNNLPPLNICIQVNISDEVGKSGIPVNQLTLLAKQISDLPRLCLRGLMAIPAPETDFHKQCAAFARVRALKEKLNQCGYHLDTLSMGMSGDMEAAIAEGSTILRIGTAIFGSREQKIVANI